MKRPRGSLALLISLLATAPAIALADTKAVFEGAGSGESASYAVKNQMVRWETNELRQQKQFMLFDGKRNVMVMVDDGRKVVMEFDEKTVRQQRQRMQAQLQPMMKQLQEKMKNMPPEQRRMLEQRMGSLMKGQQGGGAGPAFSSKEIGRSRVKGIPCRRVEIRRDGQPMHEICVANRSDTGIPQQDYDTLMQMFAFMRNMSKMASTGAPPFADNVKGVPVQMKSHMDGSVQTLKKISTSALPAAPFKAPPYPKQNFGAPMRR